jgi:hypothetical protein
MHARLNPCYHMVKISLLKQLVWALTLKIHFILQYAGTFLLVLIWNDDPLNGTQTLTDLTMAGDSLGFFQFNACYKLNS